MTKLVIVIGITGNQGGSVANTFLQDPGWRIRGLSRDTNSEASQALSVKGVEMVKADLHDPESLKDAFKGANLVFSVTDFWTPYYNPVHQARAKELGKSIGRYAYELELEQGRNIADAVAREVEGLDNVGFVASTLSHAGRSSKGRYKELWHFDSKADVFPDYVEDKYPELAKKTSYLHTGYYYFSWKYLPSWFTKVCDGLRVSHSWQLITVCSYRAAKSQCDFRLIPMSSFLILSPEGTLDRSLAHFCSSRQDRRSWQPALGTHGPSGSGFGEQPLA